LYAFKTHAAIVPIIVEKNVDAKATTSVFIVAFITEWSLKRATYHFSEKPVQAPPYRDALNDIEINITMGKYINIITNIVIISDVNLEFAFIILKLL